MLWLLLAGVLWLGWSNGSNDNFKGVATLYGSQAFSYRFALALAGIATLAGGALSIVLANGLVHSFSGGGLLASGHLPDTMLAATAVSAACTILIATLLGMPTSTTHALIGALAGTALISNPGDINFGKLLTSFAQPMLLSPIMAILLSMGIYIVAKRLRTSTGVSAASCVCVQETEMILAPACTPTLAVMPPQAALPRLNVGVYPGCASPTGQSWGFTAGGLINTLHAFSAASVCFARAVNDTPKIAALLLSAQVAGGMPTRETLAGITLAVVLGGLLQGRKVALTVSQHITELNIGQGFSANMVTAGLVIGASHLGVPVSTTHVSCGSIFGIGLVNGKRDWKTIAKILTAWVTTLPLALVLGMALGWALRTTGS